MIARLVFLLSILWSGISCAEIRTWTSQKGDTIQAEYMCMFGGNKVVLKSSSGKELKIPVAGLSATDQEYLAATIPPKIEIDVDVDLDRNKEFATEGYERRRETVKCSVDVKKTNKGPCSRTFTAHLCVFAEKVNGEIYWLISYAKQSFSFKNKSAAFCFKSSPSSVEYRKMLGAQNDGFRYDGYLVVVEDNSGNVIAMKSTKNLYEKNWSKIKGSSKGTQFDRQFDSWDDGRHNTWSAGKL